MLSVALTRGQNDGIISGKLFICDNKKRKLDEWKSPKKTVIVTLSSSSST